MSNQGIFSQQGAGLVPEVTRPLTAAMGTKWNGNGDIESSPIPEVANCLQTTCDDYSRADGFNMIAHSLRGEGFDASEDGTGRGTPLVPISFYSNESYRDNIQTDGSSVPVKIGSGGSSGNPPAVAFAQNTRDEVREMAIVGALAAEPGMKQTSYIRQEMQVRRLTPTECERLQGFPDDHTLIPWRGNTAPDGPRYKALGNSMAVPVMRWIGERINQVNNL